MVFFAYTMPEFENGMSEYEGNCGIRMRKLNRKIWKNRIKED
jgi:hypothetical protein